MPSTALMGSLTAGAPIPLVTPRRVRRCPACDKTYSGDARFCPFDGEQLLDAPDWDPEADTLLWKVVGGRYRVECVLGVGGMGTVYGVRHLTLERRFAMKVLRQDIADVDVKTRFVREAKAAAAINHPSVVTVSDFGELDGPDAAPYFIMEFLDGASLGDVLAREERLSPDRAGGIIKQAALALYAAHSVGIIHRDLKPDNVFLVRAGQSEIVKVLDFGVAKIAGASKLTRKGIVFGTPHYMSPEQAEGLDLDARTDIYALGIILYQCLTGRVPFEADTYMGVLTHHMFSAPPAIDSQASHRLDALAQVAMRCLTKSPAGRYKSMIELARAVDLALGAQPASEEETALLAPSAAGPGLRLRAPDPTPSPGLARLAAGPPMESNRSIIALGGVALVIIGGALAWATMGQVGGDAELVVERSAASSTLEAAQASAATAASSASLTTSAAGPTSTGAPAPSASASAARAPAAGPPSPGANKLPTPRPAAAPTSTSFAKPATTAANKRPGGEVIEPW